MAKLLARRQRKSNFERASDGSMTLLEHLYELRSRLFKAVVGVLVGAVGGWFIAPWALDQMVDPYCRMVPAVNGRCPFVQTAPADLLILQMKLALYIGLIIAAPIWLYQLWAFIAPGLHRHERRWAYGFIAIATPLFALGAILAHFVVATGLEFLLQFNSDRISTTLEITNYVGFVTGLMLLFGGAFEFPLIVVLFNLAGLASGRKLLGWWRIAVFLFFVFAAIATPTADPFGMSFLALALSALYFGAVGFALVNDKRRARRAAAAYGNVGDDEISPLDLTPEPIGDGSDAIGATARIDGVEPVPAPEPVAAPQPLSRRYDDMT